MADTMHTGSGGPPSAASHGGTTQAASAAAPSGKGGRLKHLSLFGFFALTASMVMTVYEYPTFASSGISLVFFLLVGGIFWFLPVALCSAEMATVKGWDRGGVFTWAGRMLGERWGFANIFFQWFQITVGFVTMIYFILGALAYVLDWSALSDKPLIEFIGVLVIFWALTFSQFLGTKFTARIARFGFIFGIAIPAVVLFVLVIAFFATGGTSYMSLSAREIVPDFTKLNTLVIFVSFILAYAGIEASASHANEMKNVKRDYPLAVIILVILAIILDTLGGVAIGAVVPSSQLGLSTGVIQGFVGLFGHFGGEWTWVVKIIAVMIAVGVIAEVSSWVVGPSWGMQVAGKKGLLPKVLSETNKHDVPTKFLLVQGIIVTIWAAVLTFGGGSDNVSFLTAIALTVTIYTAGYIIFFISYIVLAVKHGELQRAFEITRFKAVKLIAAISGLVLSICAFIISFVPPAQLSAGAQQRSYLTILVICSLIAIVLPFLIYGIARKKNPLPVGMKMMVDDEDELQEADIRNVRHQTRADSDGGDGGSSDGGASHGIGREQKPTETAGG